MIAPEFVDDRKAFVDSEMLCGEKTLTPEE